MLNTNLILPNNPSLVQYSHQNFTCDNCQQEFQNSSLYSPSPDKQELVKHQTYCPKCVELPSVVPAPVVNKKGKKTKSKTIKNPLAYYQCMQECCRQGLQGKKISQVAQECKHNSLTILSERSLEIQKLNEAYRQIGDSLGNLLKN
jgi:hypothetical protein